MSIIAICRLVIDPFNSFIHEKIAVTFPHFKLFDEPIIFVRIRWQFLIIPIIIIIIDQFIWMDFLLLN